MRGGCVSAHPIRWCQQTADPCRARSAKETPNRLGRVSRRSSGLAICQLVMAQSQHFLHNPQMGSPYREFLSFRYPTKRDNGPNLQICIRYQICILHHHHNHVVGNLYTSILKKSHRSSLNHIALPCKYRLGAKKLFCSFRIFGIDIVSTLKC